MLNKGQKVAIVIALGLVDKINENRCMNMAVSDVFNDKSCSKYITDYVNRWTDKW